MNVTVRCPRTLSADAARREVRTLINEQCFFGARYTSAPYTTDHIGADSFKATSVRPAKTTRS